jgi:hypothetical protein
MFVMISSWKADTAVQACKVLQDITNDDNNVQIIHMEVREAGMKSVVNGKRPQLSKQQRRERLILLLHIGTGPWVTGRYILVI